MDPEVPKACKVPRACQKSRCPSRQRHAIQRKNSINKRRGKITDLSMARITDWSIARRKQISTFQSSLYREPHLIYARHYVLTRTIFRTAHHSRCFIFRQIQQKDYIQLPTGTVSRRISLWGGGLLQNSAYPSYLRLSQGRVGGPSRQQVD